MTAPVALDAPARALVRAVNQQRVARGLPRLTALRRLSRSAAGHTLDQLRHDVITHDGTNGTPFAARIGQLGFKEAGEVIAWLPNGTNARARAVVRLWMSSPPHRADLLDRQYRRIGIGRRRGALGRQGGVLVTADLAR